MNRKTTKSTVTLGRCSSVGQRNNPSENIITTPKSHKKSNEIDVSFGSPDFSQYSQKEYENFDVIWDWNSSQIKARPRKHKKLDFAQPQSPEFTIRRPPSNNQIADFIKLKQELEALKDGIFSSTSNDKNEFSTVTHKPVIDLEGVFDDSMEDQLLMCSQEVEKHVTSVKLNNCDELGECSSKRKDYLTPPLFSETDLTFNSTNIQKTEVTNIFSQLDDPLETLADDSFDHLLQKMQDGSSKLFNRNNQISESTNKSESIEHKTLSIEEEIERKRQEALMKLESKKKQAPAESESPIKCSPEEIEKKRLQALAKLQAKKRQEVIEHNRLEALKRLEMNKIKRAKQFDSSTNLYKSSR